MPRSTAYIPFPTPQLLAPPASYGWIRAGNSGSNNTWPSANLAIYFPFAVPIDVTVGSLSWNLPSGNSAGRNYDIGIYDAQGTSGSPGTLLSHPGATLAAAGTNTWTANQNLTGGVRYYVALSMNNVNLNTRSVAITASQAAAIGLLQEASAEPLNATATAVTFAQTTCPLIFATFANMP